jgi:hypothetical protein
MQTWGTLEYEDATSKILPLSRTIVALLAGDARKGGQVIRDAARALVAVPAEECTVVGAARALCAAYTARRIQEVDSELGARGLSLATFYGGKQRELADHITSAIDSGIANYQYPTDMVIAGVDPTGAHIMWVGNPGGNALDCDATGFAANGGGMQVAMHVLFELGQNVAEQVPATVMRVYAAKKRSESAQGVGRVTDVSIIRAGGIVALSPERIEHLNTLYAQHHARTTADLVATAAKLELA